MLNIFYLFIQGTFGSAKSTFRPMKKCSTASLCLLSLTHLTATPPTSASLSGGKPPQCPALYPVCWFYLKIKWHFEVAEDKLDFGFVKIIWAEESNLIALEIAHLIGYLSFQVCLHGLREDKVYAPIMIERHVNFHQMSHLPIANQCP